MAILSAFDNISQRNFGILLILWCSFKLWWNFCLDQNLVYNANGPLRFSTYVCFYLIYSASFWINVMFFTFACRIINLKLHAPFPQSSRHSSSNPKPNKSFFHYCSSINFSTFRTTVVLSSTFRAKTCTTLENKIKKKKGIQKGCDCATNFYLYYYYKLIWRSAMEIVLDINVSNIVQITLLFSKYQSLPIGQNHMTCWSTKRHVHCMLWRGGNRLTMKE